MFGKILSFFRNFFTSAKNDPVSTGKGIVQLAAGGAAVYGMATGKVPVNQMTVGFATASAASGLHAIGSDNTATTIEQAGQAVQAVATQAETVNSLYQGIRQEVEAAQAVLDTASKGVADLATIVPIGAEPKEGIRG